MKQRALIVIAALLLFQGVLVGVWWMVERDRPAPKSAPAESVVEVRREERIELRPPDRELQSLTGDAVNLSAPGEHGAVVHFWGTWCLPCVDEIPAFLRRARKSHVPAVAVAVDDDPDELAAFFDGEVPPGVVEANDVANALHVRRLPQTVWVDADGVARKRWVGAQEWTAADWANLIGE